MTDHELGPEPQVGDEVEMGVAMMPLAIPPMPVPTATLITPDPANNLVVVQLHQPTGVTVVFLDPDNAERISQGLYNAARAAKRGGKGLQLPSDASRKLVTP